MREAWCGIRCCSSAKPCTRIPILIMADNKTKHRVLVDIIVVSARLKVGRVPFLFLCDFGGSRPDPGPFVAFSHSSNDGIHIHNAMTKLDPSTKGTNLLRPNDDKIKPFHIKTVMLINDFVVM